MVEITKQQMKAIFSITWVTIFLFGVLLVITGPGIYGQGSPQLKAQCEINWAGSNQWGSYNVTSPIVNYTVSAIPTVNFLLELNTYYFKFTHNRGTDKDPLTARIVISTIDDEPFIVAYDIQTDYSHQKESSLQEKLPYTINGSGFDSNSDWRDVWSVQVMDWIPVRNAGNVLTGWLFFTLGTFLFACIFTLAMITIVFMIATVAGLITKIRIEGSWYKDKDMQFMLKNILGQITLSVVTAILTVLAA